MRLVVLLLVISGCASAPRQPPPIIDAPLLQVFERAAGSNWRVRVHADTVYEGRALFVGREMVRVGEHEIAMRGVTRIERMYDARPGGAWQGAAIGGVLGLALSAGLVSFADTMLGDSGGCDRKCTFYIVVPVTSVIGFVGAMFGAGLDPSTNDWATIWQK